MKKVLSLVLVIAMVLSSMSFAFAGTFEDVAGSDYAEAIETLTALGVVTGYDDGTYKPERVVTRAEMAKLMVEILGYGGLVSGSKSNFADTQGHWADAWIALAAGKNIVVGDGNGNFRPDATVSYDEAITMVVRGLGYTDSSNELKGMSWPTNFKLKAADLGLTDDVTMLASGADRGGVAQLLFNALEATLVTVNSDGDVVKTTVQVEEDDEVKTKYVKLLSKIATNKNIDITPASIDADHKNYLGDKVDLTSYMFQNVSAYLNEDDEVVYVDDVNDLVFTGTVTGITEDEITVENADEDEYTFATTGSAIDFMYNGEDVSDYDFSVLLEDEAEVTVVLAAEDDDKLDDDIEVTGIVAKQASGYIQVEEEYVDGELELDVIYLPEDDDEVDTANLTIEGDVTSLDDIAEDDVLTVYVPLDDGDDDYFDKDAASKMTIVVSRETVEGKVTRIAYDGSEIDKVYIDGTSYKVNAEADTIEVADEGVFYLDHAGKIFAVSAENNSAPEDYALVLDLEEMVETSTGRTLADAEIKLLTASGDEITYVLDDEPDEDSDIQFGTTTNGVVAFDTTVAVGDLIKYNVNSDEEVDNVEEVAKGTHSATIDTESNSFNLASNVVVFDVPGNDIEDADVISVEDLDDEIEGYRIYDGTKIVVLIVTDGVVGEDGIFAIITDDTEEAYDEDEDDTVTLFTAYVDGEKVEYLAAEDFESIAGLHQVVELTLSDGKLEKAEAVTGTAIQTAANSRVTVAITAVDADGETIDTYYLSDDVVVYVIDADGEFDSVGSKSDIRNSDFQVFNTDSDDDYEIVLVHEAE